MKKLIKPVLLLALISLPTLTSAQLGGIGRLVDESRLLTGSLIVLLSGIALVVFFWGLIKFIFAAGSEDAKDQGKRIMIWGLIALFVMISVWGLVRFIQVALLGNSPNLSAPNSPQPPN